MKLLPKQLGDELSLDEYNAYQYLLYQMKCWKEQIILNTTQPYTGKYATYTFPQQNYFMRGKGPTYKITRQLTSNDKLTINLDTTTSLLHKDNIQYTATLYYKPPTTINNNIYDPSDANDLKEWSLQELHKLTTLEDYQTITLTCTHTDNKLTIPLWNTKNNKAYFQEKTLILELVEISIQLNYKPYIDTRNGRANTPDEILVDDVKQLSNVVHFAPNDQTPTIIRLDSNTIPYLLTHPIEIKTGQNIEIRGGTRVPAIIDGRNSGRSFRVRAGGQLTLSNIVIEHGNALLHGTFDYGRGGAILVEALRGTTTKKYGILKCNYCTFRNNRANHGGAIFSYHAGLYLNHCDFIHNVAQGYGGAIYYWARDTNLIFHNTSGGIGKDIEVYVDVTDYKGNPVPEGTMTFYQEVGPKNKVPQPVLINNTPIEVKGIKNSEGKITIARATLPYHIDENETNSRISIVAKYNGGANYEDEAVQGTITIIKPDPYKASFIGTLKAYLNTTVTIEVMVTNSKGGTITKPKGTFTIQEGSTEKKATAQTNGKHYFIKYTTPTDFSQIRIPITFELEDSPDGRYTCEPITDTLRLIEEDETERTKNFMDGQITGLFINPDMDKLEKVTSTSTTTYTDTRIKDLLQGWQQAKITDLFVKCEDFTDVKQVALFDTVYKNVIGKHRIHAVINCCYDNSITGEKKEDLIKKWGNVNPSVTKRREFVQTQLNTVLKKYPKLDGICFDYLRFYGTDKNLEYNGNIERKNRVKFVNECLDNFVAKIHDQHEKYHITMTVMPDAGSSTDYGQNYEEINKRVDYLIPLCFKGNYAIDSLNSDSWVVNSLNYIVTEGKLSPKSLLCGIQTFTSDKDVEKAKDPMSVCLSHDSLENTVTTLSTTTFASKGVISGYILYREPLIKNKEYPTPFSTLVQAGGKK